MDTRSAPAEVAGVWEADYVVVGAGSAGCVLADRLTEDGRSSVVLLEAGGPTRSVTVAVPALIQKQPSQLNWLYEVEPDPSRGGVADPYSAGRGLGGSSAINAMLWTRGHPGDYDAWADAGAKGWDFESVLPYFRRAERFEDGASEHRGDGGPVRVSRSRVQNPMIEHFLRGAEQAGFPSVPDLNAGDPEGASRSQVNQARGLRHTMADAYLAAASKRRNLTVLTGAQATRVVVADGFATAVEYVTDDGTRRHVRARREVLVCAGAIGSPRLLLLSGIGPAAEVARHGIPVRADLPAVGRGLQEHPATSLVYEVTERTVNQEVTPARLVKHGLDFVARGRGALTTTSNHAVAFGRTSPEAPLPDTELVFMAFGLVPADSEPSDGSTLPAASRGSWLARATARSGGRESGRKQVATEPLVTVTAVLLHARGRGEVTLASADPLAPPVICQALLGDEQDVAGLTAAARRARAVFEAPALAPYVRSERAPGPAVETDDQWAEHLRSSTFRLFHPAGTCRMGGADSVVDERLRVRGVGSLRVVDASVMPHLPSGNPHAATVMIAERAADLVLDDAG